MAMWRQAMALVLPLSILGCGTTGSTTINAVVPSVKPNPHQTTVASLNQVPPGGLDTLDEYTLPYFQSMGPLEYAARLGGVPDMPIWRVRLRLYPVQQGAELSYRVKVDHFNMSPALYDSLVSSYGADNVDPALANHMPHQHLELDFVPVMNVAADWLSDSTQISESEVATNPACGLGVGCAELDDLFDSEWTNGLTSALETAPWTSDSDPLPMLVRALTKQAGWLQDGGWRMPNEIPEGISDEWPWVEILVTNYAGNGGGYTAHWIERGTDDSVRAVVHQLYFHPERLSNGAASQGYICGRGADAGQIRAICP